MKALLPKGMEKPIVNVYFSDLDSQIRCKINMCLSHPTMLLLH